MPSLALLTGATATGAGQTFEIRSRDSNVYPLPKTIHANMSGTGAVTATVLIEVSNTGNTDDWLSDSTSTISLSGTNTATGGVVLVAPWQYIRARVSAISGTDAAVSVTLGV